MSDSEEQDRTYARWITTGYGDGVEVGGDENEFFTLRGDCTVTGGGGFDTFYVDTSWYPNTAIHGTTTITDFTRVENMIDISALGIKHFGQIDITMDGTTAVIDLTDLYGGVIRLENVSADDLDATDFIFNESDPVEETLPGGYTGLLANEFDMTDRVVTGGDGDNIIRTGAGYDVLDGGAGGDKLSGGRGIDTLTGGTGADEFAFRRYHGEDIVTDFKPGVDTIDLTAFGELLRFSELRLIPVGDDTVIDLRGYEGGGIIRLEGVARDDLDKDDFALRVSELVLTDGDEAAFGGDADDVIDMGGGDDIVDGGGGVNNVIGGAGSDTFQARGDHGTTTVGDFTRGKDIVDVSLLGIESFDQLAIRAEGGTAVIDLTEFNGGILRLEWVAAAGLDASDFKFRVETVKYIKVSHGSHDAYMVLSESDQDRQIMEGGAGNDFMNAQGNDDELLGMAGDDTLTGGTGDDTLTGGAGADTFRFGAKHGADTITDFAPSEDIVDLTALPEITGLDSLRISANGNDTVIDLTAHGGGTIRLEGVAAAALDAESFKFWSAEAAAEAAAAAERAELGQHIVLSDGQMSYIDMNDSDADGEDIQRQFVEGSSDVDYIHARGGDDTINSHGGDDTLVGGEGDDTLVGGEGADAFVFGADHGSDTITDFNPDEDIIRLTELTGITGFDSLSISADGDDAVIDLTAHGGGTIRLEGVARDALNVEDFEFYTPPPPEESEVDAL